MTTATNPVGREFTAMTQSANGGTQAVTITASSPEAARAALLRLGYHAVLWVL